VQKICRQRSDADGGETRRAWQGELERAKRIEPDQRYGRLPLKKWNLATS